MELKMAEHMAEIEKKSIKSDKDRARETEKFITWILEFIYGPSPGGRMRRLPAGAADGEFRSGAYAFLTREGGRIHIIAEKRP